MFGIGVDEQPLALDLQSELNSGFSEPAGHAAKSEQLLMIQCRYLAADFAYFANSCDDEGSEAIRTMATSLSFLLEKWADMAKSSSN